MQIHAHTHMVPVRRQADPSPPTLKPQELILIKGLFILKHEIGSSTKFMCQDGQGFSLTVFIGQPVEISFPWFIAF